MNEDIDVVPGENPIAVGTEEGGAKDHQVFSVPSFAFSSEFSLDPAGVCIEDVGLTRSSVFASREKQTAEKPLHGDKLISGAIVSSLEKKVSGSDDGEGSKVVASSGEQGDAGLATMMTEKLPKANSAVFFKTPAAVHGGFRDLQESKVYVSHGLMDVVHVREVRRVGRGGPVVQMLTRLYASGLKLKDWAGLLPPIFSGCIPAGFSGGPMSQGRTAGVQY
ncbi:hypothetical protein U1Q18_040769 [Sarracenia purpurea var. burkii]